MLAFEPGHGGEAYADPVGHLLAEQVGDPVLAALTGFRVANALVALGRPQSAFDLTISFASCLEPTLRTTADMSAYGNAVLQAVMAAATSGNAIGVRNLIREALTVASHVPDDANHCLLSFVLRMSASTTSRR